MKPRMFLFYLCFFISGASALVYEIVWQRMLTLVFGVSTFSVAVVVCAFLFGLAVGARMFGRWADRSSDPARLYACLELGIAVAGAATGFIVPPLMRVFSVIHAEVQPGWLGSNLIRFVLALIALGLPSVLIGATVPIMARLVCQRARSVAVGFGRFYAVNTIGSVVGAALAGFVLIQTIGVQASLWCAVTGNVAVAVLMFTVLGGVDPARDVRRVQSRDADEPVSAQFGHGRLALVVAAVAGGVGLAYEIAWMRLMAIYTLNSVYVFTMVVTVYLAALSLGSWTAARMMQRWQVDRARTLMCVQIGLGLTIPIMLIFMPAAGGLELTDPDMAAWRIVATEYALTIAIVFVPAVLIGMTLPILVGIFCHSLADAGRSVGRIYAWNAGGTIVGAAVTGMVLIPFLGLRGTLLGLAAANFLIAASVAVLDRSPPARWRAVCPCGSALFVCFVALMPAGMRFYRPAEAENETVLYYAEGRSATVHVSEMDGEDGRYRVLFVDSKSVAGTYDEIVTDQKMLAHLPLLLHPKPRYALTVGFGTGGTSYSMLQHNVRVDCVEIEPRVVDAYTYFESENQNIVGPDHERVSFHLILDDARAWLHVAPRRYDVIVTDVTSIQYRGNGNLYTTDYFRLMQERLEPGGLGCAWVPISGITPEQLKVLVRTFQTVFPHTSVWYMINLPTDFVILVGTPEPLRLGLDEIAKRMSRPLVRRDLARIGMDNPYKLAACLLLTEQGVAQYARDGVLHTDNHPVLDYMTHASVYRNTLSTNLTEMLAHRIDAAQCVDRWPDGISAEEGDARWRLWHGAATHLMEGHAALRGNDPNRARAAREAYRAAADLTPDDPMTRSLADGLEAP